ncbi:uncharacterized protein [Aegilops tauschii subsp. strangulata]|uniref:uncharacterized protein n=1 Tax=Aegilops tauschii subsp. strangulata TaxID=200361 RepID=UPI00098ADC7B|nr:F-box protein SKIP23-like [Aegilops tauschii subsp. strangulata]
MSPPPPCPSPRPVLLEEEDPDWSTLPEELLECIGKMLPSRRHALQFRSICTAWRAVLPFARYIGPLLMLPYNRDSPDCPVTFYTVADGGETRFTRNLPSLRGNAMLGSSRGWLALVDDEAASLTLLNPLTDTTVELPPADEHVVVASFSQATMLDGIQTVILLADGDVIKLDELKKSTMFCQKKMSSVFSQIVLSSSSPGSGDCVAMAALHGSSTVAFCRVGVDAAWSLLDTDLDCVTLLVHLHGSRFLAIDDECSGMFNICDVAGAAATATSVPLSPAPIYRRHYMEVNGELFVVGTMFQGSTYLWQVYKSNVFAATPSWTRVENAGDLTLFLSSNFTPAGYGGAVSVSGFKRNSAYCLALARTVISLSGRSLTSRMGHRNCSLVQRRFWVQGLFAGSNRIIGHEEPED